LPNPFADPGIAANYENWYQTTGRRADYQEKSLLAWLLTHFPGAHTILEVGCGSGHFTRWFSAQGILTVGLDVSVNMILAAKSINGQKLLLGNALHLPFPSKSFDITAMITTLEFLPDPAWSLAEALRIARKGVILGVLNRQSSLGHQYKRSGDHIWDFAQFYSPGELKQMINKITGHGVKIFWRTTLWPFGFGSLPLPWGGFIGMGAIVL
jgi:ubiquinone/menaquinone biosynthesis C-methylase UbiE